MHIADLPVQVGTIAATDHIIAAAADVDRQSRLDGDDSRNLPTTEHGLRHAARAVTQYWNAVDEISGEVMGVIKQTRPKIIAPSQIRVGNRVQVLTAATGGWIDGA